MTALVARRPKGTERTILRWLERTAATKGVVGYELRCVSTSSPYVVERFPRPGGAAEAFAADVFELAQEDANARGERSEYHLVMLGDAGGAVVDDSALATHVIRCLPKEPAEPADTGASDALKVVLDQNQALLKSYLSLATSAMSEIQRVSSSAIEASRGLLAPLVKRVEALEEENAELRATAREAEAVIAVAGATEVNEEREERRTASMEKLAAAVLTHLAQKEPKLAMLINEVVGTPKKGE